MASIFTYNSDPPRVSSPWLKSENPEIGSARTPSAINDGRGSPAAGQRRLQASTPIVARFHGHSGSQNWAKHGSTPPPELLDDYGVGKLQPEPQDGPHEYKLHILLRPRRAYLSSTTNPPRTRSSMSTTEDHLASSSPSPHLAPSNQSRQMRMYELTTQLLWRLQQSTPYHAPSGHRIAPPKLPEHLENGEVPAMGKLPSSLEESRGALYEIGVADDGTLVGLTDDEMEESLRNLEAMAACLGCRIEVLRRILVGNCEWLETPSQSTSASQPTKHRAQLWVAEVLVSPDLSSMRLSTGSPDSKRGSNDTHIVKNMSTLDLESSRSASQQLRITLTGPTMSGKTSLLGTLSTATLDNGRGKSRMSLLKHRHELESGLTSSITQELFGYKNASQAGDNPVKVINYASGIETWTDIHAGSDRIVFVSDSAGHPRYRRTTVRGLVGWAPHWTLLCIAANDSEIKSRSSPSLQDVQASQGSANQGIDLASAHLELCLKLQLPMVIVITKLDLASKAGLRETLARVLTTLKQASRVPVMLPLDQSKSISEADLSVLQQSEEDAVSKVIRSMMSDAAENGRGLFKEVPIVLTSATRGSGIRTLHALLHNLPIPPSPTANDFTGQVLNPEQPTSLFHIEGTFSLTPNNPSGSHSKIIAGHLRFGSLSIGDTVVLGPFPADQDDYAQPLSRSHSSPATAQLSGYGSSGTESSSPGAHSRSHQSITELSRLASHNAASATKSEWYSARIVSIRNLRLPVHTLEAGQVGTIGVAFESSGAGVKPSSFIPRSPAGNSLGGFSSSKSPLRGMVGQDHALPRIRKGMLLAIPSKHMLQSGQMLQAASGLTATFDDEEVNTLSPGMVLLIYVGSIRATARVLKITPHLGDTDPHRRSQEKNAEYDDEVFDFRDTDHEENTGARLEGTIHFDGSADIAFELVTGREWIELGAQVLIMPGGGRHGLYYGSERGERGVAGLDGFVGRVIQVVD